MKKKKYESFRRQQFHELARIEVGREPSVKIREFRAAGIRGQPRTFEVQSRVRF